MNSYSMLPFLVLVAAAWSLVSWTRLNASYHMRLAAGYGQSTAEEILQDPLSRTDGFALLLRGFDVEHTSVTYTGVNVDAGAHEARLSARPIEALLVQLFNIPLLTLVDPRAPNPLAGAHRFAHVPNNWVKLIRELAQSARIIVIHIASITPGIETELSLLRDTGSGHKTVVIVDRAFPAGGHSQLTLAHLLGFRHVIFQAGQTALETALVSGRGESFSRTCNSGGSITCLADRDKTLAQSAVRSIGHTYSAVAYSGIYSWTNNWFKHWHNDCLRVPVCFSCKQRNTVAASCC